MTLAEYRYQLAIQAIMTWTNVPAHFYAHFIYYEDRYRVYRHTGKWSEVLCKMFALADPHSRYLIIGALDKSYPVFYVERQNAQGLGNPALAQASDLFVDLVLAHDELLQKSKDKP